MTINLIHKGLELTPAIKAHVEDKMQSLKKYLGEVDYIDVEVGKTTNHHQKGEVFSCRANVTYKGELIHIEEEEEDLYAAIDRARDSLKATVLDRKDRQKDAHKGRG